MPLQIDISKLTNVVQKTGKIVARCPACKTRGGDLKGNNLVVFEDGRFGCAAAAKDQDHNRLILKLTGVRKAQEMTFHVPVRRMYCPPTRTIRIVGHPGRTSATPPPKGVEKTEPELVKTEDPLSPSNLRPGRPGGESFQTEYFEPEAKTVHSIRPKVPQKIQEQQKRLIWRGGGGFDPDILDENGNHTRVV